MVTERGEQTNPKSTRVSTVAVEHKPTAVTPFFFLVLLNFLLAISEKLTVLGSTVPAACDGDDVDVDGEAFLRFALGFFAFMLL